MVKITDAEFGASLRLVANTIMRADGDRDYMNPSDLNVQQTTAIADLLREAANRFESLGGGIDAGIQPVCSLPASR